MFNRDDENRVTTIKYALAIDWSKLKQMTNGEKKLHNVIKEFRIYVTALSLLNKKERSLSHVVRDDADIVKVEIEEYKEVLITMTSSTPKEFLLRLWMRLQHAGIPLLYTIPLVHTDSVGYRNIPCVVRNGDSMVDMSTPFSEPVNPEDQISFSPADQQGAAIQFPQSNELESTMIFYETQAGIIKREAESLLEEMTTISSDEEQRNFTSALYTQNQSSFIKFYKELTKDEDSDEDVNNKILNRIKKNPEQLLRLIRLCERFDIIQAEIKMIVEFPQAHSYSDYFEQQRVEKIRINNSIIKEFVLEAKKKVEEKIEFEKDLLLRRKQREEVARFAELNEAIALAADLPSPPSPQAASSNQNSRPASAEPIERRIPDNKPSFFQRHPRVKAALIGAGIATAGLAVAAAVITTVVFTGGLSLPALLAVAAPVVAAVGVKFAIGIAAGAVAGFIGLCAGTGAITSKVMEMKQIKKSESESKVEPAVEHSHSQVAHDFPSSSQGRLNRAMGRNPGGPVSPAEPDPKVTIYEGFVLLDPKPAAQRVPPAVAPLVPPAPKRKMS